MELGESAREGAAREAHEEAGVDIQPGPLLAVYNVPGQVDTYTHTYIHTYIHTYMYTDIHTYIYTY